MKTLTLSSPAKLNVFLRVLFKRPDGFHEIKTVFERINLSDTLQFSESSSDQITILCDHPQVPTGPANLIFKAATALRAKSGCSKGAVIRLDKRIPVAAGLAGGSSNAASALVGLNRLWGLKLSRAELLAIAGDLGSDISFFLHQCSWALGQGRGEQIEKLDVFAKYWHVLVTPRRAMRAPDVYGAMDLKALTNKKVDDNILIHSLQEKHIYNIRLSLLNDLEYGILAIAPDLKKAVDRMKSIGVQGVLFSGSGPSLFGLAESRREAEHWAQQLRRHYRQVFVVKTL